MLTALEKDSLLTLLEYSACAQVADKAGANAAEQDSARSGNALRGNVQALKITVAVSATELNDFLLPWRVGVEFSPEEEKNIESSL